MSSPGAPGPAATPASTSATQSTVRTPPPGSFVTDHRLPTEAHTTSSPRPVPTAINARGAHDLSLQTSAANSSLWSPNPNTPVHNTPNAAPGRKFRRRPADAAIGSASGSVPGTPATAHTPRRRKPRDRHLASLEAIRDFLRERSSYDVLPVSFRVVVLDTKLVVKPALDVLWQAGIISAPLWHSTSVPPPLDLDAEQEGAAESANDGANGREAPAPIVPPAAEAASEGIRIPSTGDLPSSKIKPGFAGMLTVNDIIHLIQYYYKFHASYDIAAKDLEHFRLESLRDIEQALQVPQPPLLSIDPLRPLYQACQLLVKTHARRLPLLDYDETTGVETVVSVLTQYRVLKFICMNCRETGGLHRSIKSCGLGTYVDQVQIATATLDTTVFDVVHIFSEKGISAVPIVDEDGFVVDMYETVDVITLVRTGAYTALDLTIRQALERRPKDFPGVYTCSPYDSVANLFALLKKVRFHRLLILEPEDSPLPTTVTAATDDSSGALASEAGNGEGGSTGPADSSTEGLGLSHGLASSAPGSGPASRSASGSKMSASHQTDPLPPPPQGSGRTVDEELEAGLRTRKRGRLVGIVCLSDMLRYIVGAEEKDLGSALKQATA
ncbi:hypothetical protein V8E36_001847 [Tilletia maclaganii]